MHARIPSSVRHALLGGGSALALWLGAALPLRAETPSPAALTQVLRASFEQPDRPMQLDPVLAAGRWGLVGWRQDGRGGRALLRRDPAVLQAAGMDAAEARALARRMTTAERQLSPRLSAELDRFPTLVQGAALAAHHAGAVAGPASAEGHAADPHAAPPHPHPQQPHRHGHPGPQGPAASHP